MVRLCLFVSLDGQYEKFIGIRYLRRNTAVSARCRTNAEERRGAANSKVRGSNEAVGPGTRALALVDNARLSACYHS